jgi:hypothetical protein
MVKSLPPFFLGCCFLLLISACETSSSQKDDGEQPRWSDTRAQTASGPVYEDDDFRLVVKRPQICVKEGPMAPGPHAIRLSVPVEILAKSARRVPVSALLFTLEDPEGHEFRPTLAGCRPAITQKTIARDEEVVGEVAFDIPIEFHASALRFEPFLIGREKVTARVKLPPALTER